MKQIPNNDARYLTVDGMLSGTGIRDSVAGGYIEPHQLNLSNGLVEWIKSWLSRYEQAHYAQFSDMNENCGLDQEGLAISKRLQEELPESKIEYYSSAALRKIVLT